MLQMCLKFDILVHSDISTSKYVVRINYKCLCQAPDRNFLDSAQVEINSKLKSNKNKIKIELKLKFNKKWY